MLRISRLENDDAVTTLKLEGKLLGPWVETMSQACAAASAAPQCLRLDLSALSFADAAGIKLLRDLQVKQVTIVACSGYVAQLLHGDKS